MVWQKAIPKVLTEGGTTEDGDEKVTVKDAKAVTIITSIGTDYKNDYPVYRTGESHPVFYPLRRYENPRNFHQLMSTKNKMQLRIFLQPKEK